MGMPSRAAMVTIKRPQEVARMRHAGLILVSVLDALQAALKPGVSTAELDEIADAIISEAGAVPSFKGYGARPALPGQHLRLDQRRGGARHSVAAPPRA